MQRGGLIGKYRQNMFGLTACIARWHARVQWSDFARYVYKEKSVKPSEIICSKKKPSSEQKYEFHYDG